MIILKKHKKISYSLIIILIVLFLLYFICTDLTFRNDEAYTMALIHQPMFNIIKLNSYDVHPPLYYILLKLFLSITTFYTKSLFVKIIFARIFSLVTFIVGFYWISKFLNISKWQSLSFFVLILLFPSVLYFATLIRMYSLAGLLLSLEFFNMYKFITVNKNKYMLYSFLFTILSFYTDYFTAISAGGLLIICFLFSMLRKRYKQGIKIFLSGFIVFIIYIPQLFLSTNKVLSNIDQENNKLGLLEFSKNIILGTIKIFLMSITGLNDSSLITKDIVVRHILYIFLIGLFIYCIKIILCNKKCITSKLLTFSLIDLGFTSMVGSIVSYEFAYRVMYPIFIINIILLFYISVKRCSHKFLNRIVKIIGILLIVLSLVFSIYYSRINYNVSRNVITLQNNEPSHLYVSDNYNKLSSFKFSQPLIMHKHQFKLINNATFYLYKNKEIVSNANKLYSKRDAPIQPCGYKIDKKLWSNIKNK